MPWLWRSHRSLQDGARTGGASLIVGAVFLVLALFIRGNALPFLSLIPYAVLGVMVAFVGLQHALLVRDVRGWQNILVVVLIAGITVATNNLALGFASGIVLVQGRNLFGMLRHRLLPGPRASRVAAGSNDGDAR